MIASEKELRPTYIRALVQTIPMQDKPSLSHRARAGCWVAASRGAYSLYFAVTLAIHSCFLVILSPL